MASFDLPLLAIQAPPPAAITAPLRARLAGVLCAMTCAATSVGCFDANRETVRTVHRPLQVPDDLDETTGRTTTPPVRSAPPIFDDVDATAVRLFYDVLAPYGTWTDDARLGLVWIPSREATGDAFVPYATHGRWSYRSYEGVDEYVWVSDLAWGWVPFHFGRWALVGPREGEARSELDAPRSTWAWIAGRRYAGAWVDWRIDERRTEDGRSRAVVGWGPTPPSHLWRVVLGIPTSRARVLGKFDPRDEMLEAIPYAAFSTPYTYARGADLFAANLSERLLVGSSAFAVARATHPSPPPSPLALGVRSEDVMAPPAMDRGLQQAWMLATPANATAVGAGPELGPPPHLRTWVAGGPRWARAAR